LIRILAAGARALTLSAGNRTGPPGLFQYSQLSFATVTTGHRGNGKTGHAQGCTDELSYAHAHQVQRTGKVHCTEGHARQHVSALTRKRNWPLTTGGRCSILLIYHGYTPHPFAPLASYCPRVALPSQHSSSQKRIRIPSECGLARRRTGSLRRRS